MKKRKEKHGKHAVFFFYALYAYTFSFPKTCRYTEIRTERTSQLHLISSMLQLVHELPGRPAGTAAGAGRAGGQAAVDGLIKLVESGFAE